MEMTDLPPQPPEMRAIVRNLQDESLVLILPGLCGACLLLILSEGAFPDHLRVTLPGLVLCSLPLAVLGSRRVSHLLAAWTLILGALAVVLLTAGWGHLDAATHLLALPAGLATLVVSLPGGLAVAAGSSLFVLLAPTAVLPASSALRATTVVATWGTVGLIWLTLRPLLTALDWSWSSYSQSRRLLERARDYQVQLKQTLADLADANLQLTRLNHLAQGLRQAADDARRAKEQFVANVSHELRTPLNMIIGFSEMILQAPEAYEQDLPGPLLADLAVIQRNSQHLSSLIDDVLDLSQIEAGLVALTKERVALKEITDAAMTAVRPLFASKGLELQADVPAELEIICDRTRIREVVLNLLSNAGRFTERGGATIRARREGEQVLISVTDTGPGIAPGDVPKVFQPFQQLDGSIRRRYGGSGLGLAISKRFVEMHDGEMWLESRQGIGTTFHVRLPLQPSPPADPVSRWFHAEWHFEPRTRPSLAPKAVMRPRVVVLETGGALRHLLSRYFDSLEIVPVSTIEAALGELERTPTQALLVNDPEITETWLRTEWLPTLPHGTPAILCSLPGESEAAGALGVAGYLVKPVQRDRLLATLARLSLRGKTILVIDDEPELLRLLRRMLVSSGRGYRVLTARDGREALRILQHEHPDAILLDLVMPEMDGFQFLAACRANPALRDIPVLVITARDPLGQPVVAGTLTVAKPGGLSVHELLVCLRGLMGTLAPAGQGADPALPARSHG